MFNRLAATLGLIVTLVLLVAGWAGPASAQRVYIRIDSPFARQFPTAVPAFRNLGGSSGAAAAEEVRQVLNYDLGFAGLFKLLDPTTFLVEPARMGMTAAETNFQAWSMIGTEFLIKGGFRGNGKVFTCEMRLFDVKKGYLLVGKRYSGTPADARLMAHRFADEIMRQVTGEPGVFQTRLTYVSNASGHKEIYVSDFDGHNAKRLTRYKSISLDPAWSADNKALAFTSYKDGRPFMYRMDLETGRVKRLMSFKGLNITPVFSPKGDLMACTLSKDGDPELYLADVRGKILKRLTDSPGIDVQASFSPDGRRIAFASNRHGGPQIFIMDIASGEVRRLTYEGNYNTSPCWSPRGDRIAYVGMKSNQFNVFTVAPDGSDLQQLTLDQGDNEHPSWSADGRMLVFSSTRDGKSAIYVMTADGGHVKRITRSKGKQVSPSWSGRPSY